MDLDKTLTALAREVERLAELPDHEGDPDALLRALNRLSSLREAALDAEPHLVAATLRAGARVGDVIDNSGRSASWVKRTARAAGVPAPEGWSRVKRSHLSG